jgi:hypothetical protein
MQIVKSETQNYRAANPTKLRPNAELGNMMAAAK